MYYSILKHNTKPENTERNYYNMVCYYFLVHFGVRATNLVLILYKTVKYRIIIIMTTTIIPFPTLTEEN